MNGVDLRQFQFDYDQTFAVLFLNPDGTVYGRYGTRAGNGPKSTTHVSLPSLKKAMERALELHRGYPANRSQLAGKQGKEPEFRFARDLPELKDRPLRVSTNKGCIHCHTVRETPLRNKWLSRSLKPADLWVYPLPENTGMKLVVDDGLRVATVTSGSPAERAGLQPGDDLQSLDGQPLVSQADVQWVLHHAANEARIPMAFSRAGQAMAGFLALSGNWKETDLGWRPSSGPGLRYGVWSTALSDEDRQKRGIPPEGMAIEVKSLFLPRAAPVQTAGVRVGDVIVAVDGRTDLLTEGKFLAHLRLSHPPGDHVKLTVQRGAQRMDLNVPMW
jgi:predicted metalloprotease with PDZ domain